MTYLCESCLNSQPRTETPATIVVGETQWCDDCLRQWYEAGNGDQEYRELARQAIVATARRNTEIQRLICDTDPNNGGSIAYSADDITPDFADRCLAAGTFADGTPITDEQRAVLAAFVAECASAH